jgi:peroxiredoxin
MSDAQGWAVKETEVRSIFRFTPGLMLAFVWASSAALAATHLSGTVAPDFALKSFAGDNLRLSEYRGDVVVLTFWANWCSDCRSQLSGVRELQRAYRDAGFRPLTVSMGRVSSSLREDMVALELGFPILDDASLSVSKLYDVESLPVALVIDREGIVREVMQGYDSESQDQYAKSIETFLAE